MRFIFGVIIGIALTVGAAYFHDSGLQAAPAPAPADASQPTPPAAIPSRAIVNWDVVDLIAKEQTAYVKGVWDRAVGK